MLYGNATTDASCRQDWLSISPSLNMAAEFCALCMSIDLLKHAGPVAPRIELMGGEKVFVQILHLLLKAEGDFCSRPSVGMLDALLLRANVLFDTVKNDASAAEVEGPIKGPHVFEDVLYHLTDAGGGEQLQHVVWEETITLNTCAFKN